MLCQDTAEVISLLYAGEGILPARGPGSFVGGRASARDFRLVLRQGSFDEYRATQNVQDKAQFAGNGCSIDKGCNAVLNVLGGSLRASREAAIRGVAPLGDGTTITREARLAASRFPARCIHQSYLVGALVL